MQKYEVVFLWNRTLVAFVDKLSSTTVDFIRSEGELKNCLIWLSKVQFLSSPSDLIKSTVLDKSLSTNATRVLFQRRAISLLQETTE